MATYTVREMLEAANAILTPRLTDNRLNGIEQSSIASVMTGNTTVRLLVPDSGTFSSSTDRRTYGQICYDNLSVLTAIDGHHGNDFTPAEFYNATDFEESAASAISEGDATREISQ